MAEIKCYDTGEIAINYTAYLKTTHWKGIKVKYRALYINECVMCHTDKNLNIHHMSYDRVGNENFEDLVFLCKDCHSKLHDALGDKTTSLKLHPRLKPTKAKKNAKGKTVKGKRTCSQCIDSYHGYCLLGLKVNGYKNKDGKCKKFKQNESKKRYVSDSYDNYNKKNR